MANDQTQLDTFWPHTDGNARIARLPRLDRNPWVHFAIIQLNHALIVDDQTCVIRIAARVQLHDRKAAPDRVVDAGLF